MSLKCDLYIDFSACQYVLLISFTCSSKFPAKITQWFCAKHFARVKWNVSSRIKNYFHKNNSFFHSIIVKSPEFINFTLYTQSMIRQWKFNERKRYFCNILLLSHTFLNLKRIGYENSIRTTSKMFYSLFEIYPCKVHTILNRKYNQYRNS